MALVTKNFSDIITFTRASTGTFFNSAGVLTSAAINAPRFDYNPSTLAAQGLLIEEARTNLIFPSEDFANATYTPTNVTGVVNAAVAPDGTTTADELVENTATGAHGFLGPVVNVANATVYTVSIFAKVKAGTRNLFIYGQNVAAYLGTNAGAKFTVSGTVISTGTTYGTSTNSVQSIGNGWYRCVVTFPATVAANAGQNLRIVLDNGTGSPSGGAASYTGDGTSGFFVWGAQLEAGAFPTSYIPTTTTALTRSADVASVNTLSPWYNATAGTLYAEAQIAAGIGSAPAVMAGLDDTTINNRIQLRRQSPGTVGDGRFVSSGGNWTGTVTSGTLTGVNKQAVAYAASDQAGAVNGTLMTGIVSVATLPTITRLALGDGQGSTPLNGYLRRITYYPRRLTNAELQAITA